MDENTPSENTLLPAACAGLQSKIKTPQETLKVRSGVFQKHLTQAKQKENPNLQEITRNLWRTAV